MSELILTMYFGAIFGALWYISSQLDKILAALKRNGGKEG